MEKGNAVKNLIKKNQLMITALAIMIAIAGYLQFAGTNLEKEYLAADDADTLSAVDSTDIVTDMESLDSDMDIVMEDYLEEDMQVAEATPEEGEIPGEAVLTGTSGVEVLSAARLSKEQTRARNKETLLEIINSTELSDAQKQEAVDSMVRMTDIAEKEAAYLLLPYTEEIRQSVEQLLDERYQQYLEAEFADDPEERVARAAEGKPAVIPDWDGPLFCYASDRVAQDGCKVQIMDRLFPEREDMGWESGWAFYSGDEGDVYGEGDEYYESHCGFYDIRDICRIDPDIIRFLNLPYGTMQMRSEDGAWYEVIRDDEGEEET